MDGSAGSLSVPTGVDEELGGHAPLFSEVICKDWVSEAVPVVWEGSGVTGDP